ncbi:related to pisatin demethylase (cytochrome P450) [Cephalotrichum gorgonifer]|uniref:Related to pisatin demethylase (Cytochrome P450) n=1 Tax=Cephalotrichum gorgonifer TaxID=2041049 RepID=A0AAE8SSX8_9PEZI|nr:related to pisatin demethylase (cytochrome P450) [Cephalotrichum gorgonifer]
MLPFTNLCSEHASSIVLAATLLYLAYSVRSWYRLRQFDGPWLARHSYLWLLRAVSNDKLHLTFPELHKKYGSIVRIGPNDLVTNDADLLRHMSVYSVISDINTKSHDRFKSYMALGYSGKDVPSLEADISAVIETFMKVIKRDHLSTDSDTKITDFSRLCTYFTIDSISKLGFGEPMGYLEHNADRYGYIEAVHKALPIISIVSVLPLATTILNIPFIKNTFAPSRKDTTGIGRLLTLADRTAERALADDPNKRHDMVSSWLRRGYPRDARRLSADIVLQLVAGGDSTATVIKTTALYLISNYRVLQKLRRELDEAEEAGRISTPVVTNKESLQLPYLQAVVKEGLRIFVPGHGLLIKQVPPGGDTIGGKWVPGGTRIAHSQWSQQRDPIYGSDPDRFYPERWLEADSPRRALMEKQLDTAFGLFRRYDFELSDPVKPMVVLPHSVFIAKDMHVRITEREKQN